MNNIKVDVKETAWSGFIPLRMGSRCGLYDHVNKPRVYVKGAEFPDRLINNHLLAICKKKSGRNLF